MGIAGGPNIIEDGLVLALDAADKNSYPGSGTTWFDLSGNGNNSSLVNGPTYNTNNDGAIVLDGINDSISYPSITFTNQPYSLELFGKITSTIEPTANRRSIFGNVNYASEFSNTTTYFTNITCDSTPSYFNFSFSSAGSLVVGSIFHWAFTINSSKVVQIFLNSRAATADNQLTGFTNISSNFTRFGIWTTIRPYIGDVYSIKIYNKALSASEVLQNYNALKSRFNL
jgi:hypothetical protein